MAFRGSVELQNWFADAWVALRAWSASECEGCLVHSGISDAFRELLDDLEIALQELQCTQISIAGHSLGAAIGSMAAFWLRSKKTTPVNPVYLFGMPRVGNAAFSSKFEELARMQGASPSAWRIVHNLDPVPRLWPHSGPISSPYVHFAREVYYAPGFEQKFRVCAAPPGEDPNCMFAEPLWRCIAHVADHLMYMNLTFDSARMDSDCVAAKGYIHGVEEAWDRVLSWSADRQQVTRSTVDLARSGLATAQQRTVSEAHRRIGDAQRELQRATSQFRRAKQRLRRAQRQASVFSSAEFLRLRLAALGSVAKAHRQVGHLRPVSPEEASFKLS